MVAGLMVKAQVDRDGKNGKTSVDHRQERKRERETERECVCVCECECECVWVCECVKRDWRTREGWVNGSMVCR